MNFRRKFRTPFRAFATSTVAEVVKASVTTLTLVALPIPALGTLLGTVSKDLVEALFVRASQVESKLDRLIREPLQTGVALMRQGLTHEHATLEEQTARNTLLDNAHVALTRAWALVSDSREDAVFVRSLDCIVLAAHPGHRSLANRELVSLHADLDQMRLRLELLEKEAAQVRADSQDFDRFLDRDSLRDKPFGHMEQRLMGRRVREKAAKMVVQAENARSRFDILEGLTRVASRFVEYRQTVSSGAIEESGGRI
jgi:hypothetical protein